MGSLSRHDVDDIATKITKQCGDKYSRGGFQYFSCANGAHNVYYITSKDYEGFINSKDELKEIARKALESCNDDLAPKACVEGVFETIELLRDKLRKSLGKPARARRS